MQSDILFWYFWRQEKEIGVFYLNAKAKFIINFIMYVFCSNATSKRSINQLKA